MNISMRREKLTPLERTNYLEEKYKELFKVELKNVYFSKKRKEDLTLFVDRSIEALFFLYLMWHTQEGLNPRLYRGMTKRSVWFFIHGQLLQRFVDMEWEPELGSMISESIVDYIVSQAFDLFGIRAGITKIN